MKRRLGPSARHLALSVLWIAGCETILDARFDEARPFPDSGARLEGGAGIDGGVDAGAICELKHPPPRQTTPGATDQIEFVVVIHDVDLGDRIEGGEPVSRSIGYDIDNQCTNRTDPPNCTPPAWTDTDLTDGPNGQDNAVGGLLLTQETYFGTAVVSSEGINTNVAMGFDAPFGILRVSDFGGLGEDDHVVVEWFVPEALGSPALYDGSDAWPIRDESFESSGDAGATGMAVFRDDDAFVTRRELVARFDVTRIPLLNVYFDVYEVVLTANTVRDATGVWTLQNGTIAGHAPVNSLVRVIPEIAAKNFDAILCTDNTVNYRPLKSFICAVGDLPEPGAPAGAPCSRASLGVAFETRAASLGPTVPTSPNTVVCPPETDPANDTCDTPPPALPDGGS